MNGYRLTLTDEAAYDLVLRIVRGTWRRLVLQGNWWMLWQEDKKIVRLTKMLKPPSVNTQRTGTVGKKENKLV